MGRRVVRPSTLLLTAVCALGLGALTSGCGPVLYTANVISAGSAVAEAEEAHADLRAPYEFYGAREYLLKAREEASEGHYEAAVRYAGRAHELGERARDRARAIGAAGEGTAGDDEDDE